MSTGKRLFIYINLFKFVILFLSPVNKKTMVSKPISANANNTTK